MRLKYSMKALSLYAKQTGKTVHEISQMVGIGSSTLNRYVREERLPDIDILLKICNTLHIRIDSFFLHPDIELSSVEILHPEEWSDITFRNDRIEAVRLERNLSKSEIIHRINEYAGTRITLNTYNHFIMGDHLGYDKVLGIVGALDVDINYLFEQRIPLPAKDAVVIPRRELTEMKEYIKTLEDTIRELECKNKRLEKMKLPRYQGRMENLEPGKIIKTFIRQVERNLAELKSWTTEDSAKPSASVPYGEIEDRTLMVAESD